MSMTAVVRRIVRDVYGRLAAGAGGRALDRSLRGGLPVQLEPALRFLFTGELPESARQAAERVEVLRASIAARPDRFRFVCRPSPLGPARWPEPLPEGQRAEETTSIRELAERTSVPRRWGLFLHLLCEGFETDTVLETGACVGISGAYLATASTHPRFVTVEGSEALAAITKTTLTTVSDKATVVAQPFETGLDIALSMLHAEDRRVDLAYIDGHHDEQATLHYVRQVLPHLSSNAIVVLDDIHLYSEMWNAWQSIIDTYGFVASVNVGRFGILVWNGTAAPSTARYDLARFTGWWRVGPSRQRSLHTAT